MKGLIDSFHFLKKNKISLANWKLVLKHEDLSTFGFPCYLKIDSGEHKFEIGGIVKCYSLKDCEEKLLKMHKKFPDKQIIIQENVDGIEMIIGLKEDIVFGKVLVVGFGGSFVEVNKDVSFRALPLDKKDISEMIGELKGFEIFSKRKKYNLKAFEDLVFSVGKIGSEIGEMDLNPVIVSENGAFVVDARMN